MKKREGDELGFGSWAWVKENEEQREKRENSINSSTRYSIMIAV